MSLSPPSEYEDVFDTTEFSPISTPVDRYTVSWPNGKDGFAVKNYKQAARLVQYYARQDGYSYLWINKDTITKIETDVYIYCKLGFITIQYDEEKSILVTIHDVWSYKGIILKINGINKNMWAKFDEPVSPKRFIIDYNTNISIVISEVDQSDHPYVHTSELKNIYMRTFGLNQQLVVCKTKHTEKNNILCCALRVPNVQHWKCINCSEIFDTKKEWETHYGVPIHHNAEPWSVLRFGEFGITYQEYTDVNMIPKTQFKVETLRYKYPAVGDQPIDVDMRRFVRKNTEKWANLRKQGHVPLQDIGNIDKIVYAASS
jgi:hypothetical protein